MRWTRFALAVLCVIGTAGVADLSPASAAPAPSAGPAPPAAAVPTADAPPPGGFRAVAPVRVLDTRYRLAVQKEANRGHHISDRS